VNAPHVSHADDMLHLYACSRLLLVPTRSGLRAAADASASDPADVALQGLDLVPDESDAPPGVSGRSGHGRAVPSVSPRARVDTPPARLAPVAAAPAPDRTPFRAPGDVVSAVEQWCAATIAATPTFQERAGDEAVLAGRIAAALEGPHRGDPRRLLLTLFLLTHTYLSDVPLHRVVAFEAALWAELSTVDSGAVLHAALTAPIPAIAWVTGQRDWHLPDVRAYMHACRQRDLKQHVTDREATAESARRAAAAQSAAAGSQGGKPAIGFWAWLRGDKAAPQTQQRAVPIDAPSPAPSVTPTEPGREGLPRPLLQCLRLDGMGMCPYDSAGGLETAAVEALAQLPAPLARLHLAVADFVSRWRAGR